MLALEASNYMVKLQRLQIQKLMICSVAWNAQKEQKKKNYSEVMSICWVKWL